MLRSCYVAIAGVAPNSSGWHYTHALENAWLCTAHISVLVPCPWPIRHCMWPMLHACASQIKRQTCSTRSQCALAASHVCAETNLSVGAVVRFRTPQGLWRHCEPSGVVVVLLFFEFQWDHTRKGFVWGFGAGGLIAQGLMPTQGDV